LLFPWAFKFSVIYKAEHVRYEKYFSTTAFSNQAGRIYVFFSLECNNCQISSAERNIVAKQMKSETVNYNKILHPNQYGTIEVGKILH
jgi:hypothetical protein